MTEANKRYIDITDVIRVGFNYPKNKFYVTNKDTTTYRTTTEDTLDVLQTLGIDEVTEAQLEFLRDNWETLDKIYYTWDKTGSFIHSIQFNDWHDYPIIMDCHKAKMYIQNSTTIFDLDTAESAEIVRIPLIFNFFQQTLGIEISTNILLAVYNMLLSYYNPEAISSLYKKYFLTHRCTNQIAPRSEDDKDKEARYTGIFQTSNFDNNNPVEYTCTNDPLNNPIPVHIGNIGSINADTNTITLTKPLEAIDPYTIEVGSKIIVVGASTIVDEETYIKDILKILKYGFIKSFFIVFLTNFLTPPCIGKCLAKLLHALGACVTVAARKESRRVMIEALGYRSLPIEKIRSEDFRLIINTVPAMVLPEAHGTALKIDLATIPGIAGRDILQARGLPGLLAPESSGSLIAQTIIQWIKEK